MFLCYSTYSSDDLNETQAMEDAHERYDLHRAVRMGHDLSFDMKNMNKCYLTESYAPHERMGR